MAGYGSLGQRQTRPVDRALTDSARRSLVALADGLAADPESGTRVLHTLVELCSDSSVRHDGSPTTGVAAEHRLDPSVPGAWTVSRALSADGRT
ncbi:MAG: hypothetical protein JWM12_3641 [Ilumatobacteraceae bacterium]|nr:hypothetical protein [Ilumatobacteraceae bacterium]